MPATVKTLCDAMEAWAPAALAYDWDAVGLQTGQPSQPVQRVLTCLTITEDVVRRAERWGAQMIVAHHPLVFRPMKNLRTDDPHTALCLHIAAANIACFAAHTNLDVVPQGVNTLLADDLGLLEAAPLIPAPGAGQVKLVAFVPETHLAVVREALANAGAGQIGAYSECSFSTPGTGTFRPDDTANPFSGRVGALDESRSAAWRCCCRASSYPPRSARSRRPPYDRAYDIVPSKIATPASASGRAAS